MSRVSACAAACSALFAFLLGLTGQSSAATFVVTTTADSNDGACTVALCSLRDAVIASNATAAPNVIALPAGHYTLTIPGAGEAAAATGDLNVTQDVTINGAGAATTIVDGNGLDRVFDVHASVVLNGLTITGGRAGSSQQGGGIRNDGDLTLNDCVVASNQAPSGGGIYSQVRLTLNNTSVVANVASGTGDGGGIANPFGGNATINSSRISGNSAALGGGLSNGGDATISDTTIAFNTAGDGLGAGIYHHGQLLAVGRSTLSQNSTTGAGGAIYVVFAGLGTGIGTKLTNVTINGNTAAVGAGVANFGMGGEIIASTIANNNGAGVQDNSFGSNPIRVTTTIIADNSGTNCGGTIIDGGTNLQFPGASCGSTIPTADPRLGPLTDNGGATATQALLPGSPAIDAGTTGCPPTPPTDQRGLPRPFGTACDIGAFEAQITVAPTTTGLASSANPSTVGQSVTFTATVSGGTNPTGTVQFKDGATNLGSPVSVSNRLATFTTSALPLGSHAISALYSGDASNAGSSSNTIVQAVNAAGGATTTTSLTSSPNPATAGEVVTLTAIVTGSGPTGTVHFTDGGVPLGIAPLVGGVATLSTTTLAVGTHTLSAGYPGDANNAASTSNAVSQVIDAAQVGLPPAIPTLDAFGLLVLAALLAVAAAAQSRRR